MGANDMTDKHEQKTHRAQSWTPAQTFGIPLFLYFIVEIEFLVRLSTLIGKHAPPDYLFNAVAFQVCFVASGFGLWRILRLVRSGEEAMQNYKRIVEQITILVIMLTLSLMQFSSFTQEFDKIR